ncbi:MAG: hypothetical protein IJH12_09475 [Clostridia bacterium]|nr:hypothetical protein [Clostridia bacterium]
MTRERELALVKEIILDGYDNLDIISFELDIPMKDLIAIKRQADNEKMQARRRAENIRSMEDTRAQSIQKIWQLRRNYECVYNGMSIDTEFKEVPKEIPDNETVERVMKEIEELFDNEKVQKSKRLLKVLGMIKEAKDERFSLEQAEKIVTIIRDRELLPMPNEDRNKSLNYIVTKYKKAMVAKLVEAIKIKLELTNDVEELKALNRKLPYEVQQIDPISVAPLKLRISSKITKIQTDRAIYNMENNFSDGIITIVENLASKKVDTKLVSQLVDNEVKVRIESNHGQKYFLLDKNQQKTQVFFKIAKALEKYAEQYHIQNPARVMEVLEEQFGMGFDNNFRAVIHNYIERKEYNAAKLLCDYYVRNFGTEAEQFNAINRIRVEIQKAEIGDIILRGIHAQATVEEQERFFELLEKRMKTHNYAPISIPLGKTKDGMKKITLADIWEEERKPRR